MRFPFRGRENLVSQKAEMPGQRAESRRRKCGGATLSMPASACVEVLRCTSLRAHPPARPSLRGCEEIELSARAGNPSPLPSPGGRGRSSRVTWSCSFFVEWIARCASSRLSPRDLRGAFERFLLATGTSRNSPSSVEWMTERASGPSSIQHSTFRLSFTPWYRQHSRAEARTQRRTTSAFCLLPSDLQRGLA